MSFYERMNEIEKYFLNLKNKLRINQKNKLILLQTLGRKRLYIVKNDFQICQFGVR